MSRRLRLLVLGWLALVADVVYCLWTLGQSDHYYPSNWHGALNLVLFFGAPVLFVVLLILSLLQLIASLGAHGRTREPH